MLNVAIFSAQKNAYSETFITAQKDLIPQNVFYYYDGLMPSKLEGGANYTAPSVFIRLLYKFLKKEPAFHLNYLKNSFIKNKIQVMLIQFGPTGVANAELAVKMGIPMIVHFHGADAYATQFINPIEPYSNLFKVAAGLIVVSEDMKNQLIKLGASPDKIYKTACGPRDEFFSITPDFSHKIFLAIGRFVDKKAPYFTILAFSKIVSQHDDARLIMVGSGPLVNTCINMAKYLGIEGKVEFSGALKHDDILRLMSSAACFVQHSVTAMDGDKEGSPVAIVEAGAAGLPVISTIHAGITYAVIHEQTGYLVNEGDVDRMAEYMLKICDDLQHAKILGEAGRNHIRENLSMEKYINDLNNILLKLSIDV